MRLFAIFLSLDYTFFLKLDTVIACSKGIPKQCSTNGRSTSIGQRPMKSLSPVCLSVCLSIYLSICLFVCPSVCSSIRPSVCLSVRLSVCLSVRLSIRLSVGLSTCRFITQFSQDLIGPNLGPIGLK